MRPALAILSTCLGGAFGRTLAITALRFFPIVETIKIRFLCAFLHDEHQTYRPTHNDHLKWISNIEPSK